MTLQEKQEVQNETIGQEFDSLTEVQKSYVKGIIDMAKLMNSGEVKQPSEQTDPPK